MPNNGKIFEAKNFEFSLSSSASVTESGDGDPTYGHGASASTAYAPNAVITAIGLFLATGSTFDGTAGSWSATYDGPGAPFGGYTVSGGSFAGSVEIKAMVKGLEIYATLFSLWRIVWSGIDIYVNGSLSVSLTGSSVDETSAGLGPNYIPFIGIPLELAGGVSAGRANVPASEYDACNPGAGDFAWSTDVTGEVSGGYRWQDYNDVWHDVAVRPYVGSAPSGTGCPFGLSMPGVGITRTHGGSISCRASASESYSYEGRQSESVHFIIVCTDAIDEEYRVEIDGGTGPSSCIDPCTGVPGSGYRDIFKSETKSESVGGSIRLVPNLPKTIERMTPDYSLVAYRTTMPETTAFISRDCVDGVVSFSNSDLPVVHPGQSEFLGQLRSSVHAMEDTLGYPSYAPTAVGSSKSHNISYTARGSVVCECPPGEIPPYECHPPSGLGLIAFLCDSIWPETPTDVNKSESVSSVFPATVDSWGSYQTHNDREARYLASWPNPHWSFFVWRDDWEVDGTPVPWAEYWGLIREQFQYNPALPGGGSRTRNSMLMSALEASGHTPFLDAFVSGLRWIGACRFQVDEVEPPDSIALTADSDPAWSSPDDSCTIAAGGGGIVITPTP